jgi:hypothetical protein
MCAPDVVPAAPRPATLHADKGYDGRRCRNACVRRRAKHGIAQKRIESKERLRQHRWIVERTSAWLTRYRPLTIWYERHADMHRTIPHFACDFVCFDYVLRWWDRQFARRHGRIPLRAPHEWQHVHRGAPIAGQGRPDGARREFGGPLPARVHEVRADPARLANACPGATAQRRTAPTLKVAEVARVGDSSLVDRPTYPASGGTAHRRMPTPVPRTPGSA